MRKDIMADPASLKDYVDGVWALKNTAAADPRYSRYDWYVLWHAVTMMSLTPPGNGSGRNAAHSGPAFLPWHRFYLKRLEVEIAQVLGKPEFALPYWNWVADGHLGQNAQRNAPIWQANALGGSGVPVADGPFQFDTANPDAPGNWAVRIEMRPNGLFLVRRGLERRLGIGLLLLPNASSFVSTIRRFVYDRADWDRTSAQCLRNDLEGWRGGGMHNRVHGWIGGDMGRGHSPNDPIFFLHHCNVDRIWAFWQSREGAANYQPDDTDPDFLQGHRPSDICQTLGIDPLPGEPISAMFADASASYDSFADLQALLDAAPIA
ncbi:MAG: tyrosinase family protein [Paracoccaceae bacterium]